MRVHGNAESEQEGDERMRPRPFDASAPSSGLRAFAGPGDSTTRQLLISSAGEVDGAGEQQRGEAEVGG